MARPLRPSIANADYAITLTGLNGQQVFQDVPDSEAFLGILGAACRRFRWSCRAFCLLPIGYRLVIHTHVASLSRGMRQVNGLYSEAFHRRHGTRGALFQGRYKAVLFEAETQLATVCRSVFQAPCRAGLASHPKGWRWSSYRTTLSGAGPQWLDRAALLSKFEGGPDAVSALAAYMDAAQDDAALWRQVEGQVFLGSPAFIARMRQRLNEAPPIARHARDLREIYQQPLESFAARCPHPHEAMARAYLAGGYTLAQVAQHFAVHESTVSRAVQRHEDRTPGWGRLGQCRQGDFR